MVRETGEELRRPTSRGHLHLVVGGDVSGERGGQHQSAASEAEGLACIECDDERFIQIECPSCEE